jgi:hypothetical protein
LDKSAFSSIAAANDKFEKASGILSASDQAICLAQVFDTLPEFEIKVDGFEQDFDIKLLCQPLYFLQRCWSFPLEMECLPIAGVGNFFQVTKGFAFVVVVEIAHVILLGATIETLSSYFAKIDLEYFSKQVPCFGVAQGDAIWVPTGSMAVPIGVKTTCYDHFDLEYVVYPVLDTKRLEKLTLVAKMEVYTILQRGLSRKLKVFKGKNETAIGDWVKLLQE